MDAYYLLSILGMACVTVIARAFFLFANESFQLPSWLERALLFAPIAALSAVIAPEILMSNHQLIASVWNAKLVASSSCVLYFFIQRHQKPSVLKIIVLGLAIYLPLHLWLGI